MSDRVDHIQGFVFVHGINQTQEDLDGMQQKIEGFLKTNGMLDRFIHDGKKLVWCAKWRSLGNFMEDVIDLATYKVRREQAVVDIQAVIELAWNEIDNEVRKLMFKTGLTTKSLLVCAHSMGQPLAVAAINGMQRLVTEKDIFSDSKPRKLGDMFCTIPTSLLSIGGPMGNSDPVVDGYLTRGLDGSPWVKLLAPQKPAALDEWIDVWNPLDPVSCAPLLGSHQYPGSTHQMFKVPGQLPIAMPFENTIAKYHSAYFQYPDIYKTAASILDRMSTLQGG